MAESRSAALRALERASVKRPDASLISGCCQFYVQKKAEGLNAQQAEVDRLRGIIASQQARGGGAASSYELSRRDGALSAFLKLLTFAFKKREAAESPCPILNV